MICQSNNSTANAAHEFLNRHGIVSHLYHGAIPAAERQSLLSKIQRSSSMIMICTNIASRGLDFANIDHVIQLEFAHSLVDHLHRIGR